MSLYWCDTGSRHTHYICVSDIMYNFQDYSVFYNNTVGAAICEGFNLTHTWTALFSAGHVTSLTPPLFTGVHVPSQASERSCIWVLRVLIVTLSTILLLDYKADSTMWYFWIMFCF